MAPDAWSSAEQYEPFIGRWSRLVARDFVAWLEAPAGLRWLDVGWGTGALTEGVLKGAAPASVVGLDPSPAYVAAARSSVTDPRASFQVGAAGELPVPGASVDAVVAGLVLNFVPDPDTALREMRRVLVPGGIAAAYVWDYTDGMQMLRLFWDAAVAEDPAAAALDEGARFPICRPGALETRVAAAGLTGTVQRAIEIRTRFRDFGDYWTPFLGGQGPAPGYCAGLTDEGRERLRARLEAALPTAPDGSITLTARTWAVRGVAP